MSDKRLDEDNNHNDSPNQPENDKDLNHVSVNVEINPESQLVQRRQINGNEKTTDMNGKNMDLPATLDVGELKMVNLGHVNKIDVTKDEDGLSKGVVLNATQLYPPKDVKWNSDNHKEQELKQNHPIKEVQEPPSETKQYEQSQNPEDEKMSLTRKIVFGASFIPSILFVLCFAVILPCEQPSTASFCRKNLWTINLNNTDLSIDFGKTDQSLLLSSVDENQTHKLISINTDNGHELWTKSLDSDVKQMECQKLKWNSVNPNNTYDCLVLAGDGILYSYNSSNGFLMWKLEFNQSISSFAILPDCDEDGIQEIAVVVSTRIRIISNGLPKLFIVTNCSSTPTHLTTWLSEGSSYLVYVCEKGSEEKVVEKLDSRDICSKEKGSKISTTQLYRSHKNDMDFKNVLFKQTDDNLVMWNENILTSFSNDIHHTAWSITVSNHSDINRYLFYGNFSSIGNDLLLISEDFSSNIQITLVDAASGNETLSQSMKSNGLKNAVTLRDKEKNVVLILMQEKQEKNVTSSLVESTLTAVTNQPILDSTFHTFASVQANHRLVMLDFKTINSKLSVQKEEILSDPIQQNGEAKILSATTEDKGFKLYLGQTLISTSGLISSELKAYQVKHRDESESRCKSS